MSESYDATGAAVRSGQPGVMAQRSSAIRRRPAVNDDLTVNDDPAVNDDDDAVWMGRTRVVLSPMAAPSIMGLFGFMAATLMVGAWQAGWYGNAKTPLFLWPLTLVAGGLLQLVAAAACFRARDGVALAVHSIWGAFWVAWSVMQILVATGVMAPLALGSASPGMAFWFIALTLITGSAALGAIAASAELFVVLSALTVGSAFTAAGFYAGNLGSLRVGGWLFVVSAAAAWFVATAMVFENAYGRTIIPLGKWSKGSNIPGRVATAPIQRSSGEPGVKVGQ